MEINSLTFQDIFEVAELQALQDAFARATGVASIITAPDGTPITEPSNFCRLCNDVIRCTERGLANCMRSDAVIGGFKPDGPSIQPCLSGGLWDAGASIFLGEMHVANWLIGQVLDEDSSPDAMLDYAREIGADEEEFRAALSEVTLMSRERFQDIADALYHLAILISGQASNVARQRVLIGELEAAREALAASEKRYELVARGANDGIWDWDPHADKVYFSPRYKEILGYTDADFSDSGEEWRKRIHPDDVEHTLAANQECLEGKVDQFEVEYRMLHKDGSWRWILGRGASLKDDKGRVVRLAGTHTDITDRKEAERELADNKRLLESVIEQSPVPMAVATAPDFHIRYLNTGCRDILGMEKLEDFLGQSVIDAPSAWEVYASDGTRVDLKWLPLSLALRGEKTRGEEYRIERPDGRSSYVVAYGTPIYDDQGILKGGHIAFPDITEQKQAEHTLRFLRNSLRSIVNSMPSVLVGTDRDLTVTQWNKAAEAHTGVSSADAIGKRLADVFPLPASLLRDVEQAITGGVRMERSRMPLSGCGESRHVDILVFPLEDAESPGAVIRLDDVSERVVMEQLMVQTEKMMSVGGLAAGMAHELNNPLGGIMQGVQNIKRRMSAKLPANRKVAERVGLDFEALDEYLHQRDIIDFIGGIQESGERAASIIRNMLAFSRKSESGRAPCDVHVLLDNVVKLASSDYDLRKSYDFRKVRIEREYAEDLPLVRAAETEIEQVFLNLLKNAAQAMAEVPDKDRESVITLRTSLVGSMVRIEFEDNGPGVADGSRKRLFEPFFTTKPPGVGTGLGLSVSYFIITQNHGGRINVDSVPGGGTRFTIHLPLVR